MNEIDFPAAMNYGLDTGYDIWRTIYYMEVYVQQHARISCRPTKNSKQQNNEPLIYLGTN